MPSTITEKRVVNGICFRETFLQAQLFTAIIENGKNVGFGKHLPHTLRDRLREKMGRLSQPSAIAADSQSVKTTEKRGMYTALMVAS